ncbi:MAG: hypothetical protein LBE18_03185 [Planctomycetaceae bacterium]|nr:hypothetical protein [Planctomycetaceae bacterium]
MGSYSSAAIAKKTVFLIRQHAVTRWKPTTELVQVGEVKTGTVFEQQGYLESPETK